MGNEPLKTTARRIFDSQGTIMRSKKIRKRELDRSGLWLILILFHIGCMNNDAIASDGNADSILNGKRNAIGMYARITTNDSVQHIVIDPAFKGFGQYLLPWDNGANDYDTRLNNVGSLLPYHNHVDPNIVVAASTT